jgi:hypothetical protein
LLACGAPAKPDPRRSDFYELEDGNRVFYIHITPVNGNILLLATWVKDEQPARIKIAARPQAAPTIDRGLATAFKVCPCNSRGGGPTTANP